MNMVSSVAGSITKVVNVVIVLMAVVYLLSTYVHFANLGNQLENRVKAEYTNLENILGQYGQSIAEAAQIPALQADDLTRIFTNTLEARYGADGSQAAFQWLQEQNPQLDQSTYAKIQTMIEAGRNRYTNAQSKFIDLKREYETLLGYVWSGFWLQLAGYPKIDLDDYVIISTSRAREAFETKIEAPLQLR